MEKKLQCERLCSLLQGLTLQSKLSYRMHCSIFMCSELVFHYVKLTLKRNNDVNKSTKLDPQIYSKVVVMVCCLYLRPKSDANDLTTRKCYNFARVHLSVENRDIMDIILSHRVCQIRSNISLRLFQ